jgi:DegV family protein with EDD domain
MSSKVTVLTDSSAYLPEDLVSKYSIEVIPLSLVWGDAVYRDGIDIKADTFYEKLAHADTLPSTSQTTVYEYEEACKALLEAGRDVLVLPISGGLSASVESARQAKSNLKTDRVEVLDTRLVSMALGFQVLSVARAAEAGASLSECKAIAERAYPLIGVYFSVDTLEFLHRGGRINTAKRLMGTALNLKPILEIRDGKIEPVGNVISQRKAMDRMTQLVESKIGNRQPVRLSVFHAGIPEIALEFKSRLDNYFNPTESILTYVSPVVGTHSGPGTISLAYMAGEV